MADKTDKSTLPPHVVLPGEALRPLLLKVEAMLDAPSDLAIDDTGDKTVDDTQDSFFAVDELTKLHDSYDRIFRKVSTVFKGLARSADVSDAKVRRAVGRLEALLDELLDIYAELVYLGPFSAQDRGAELLLAVVSHTLKEIADWLRGLIEAAADPMDFAKRRGLGDTVKLELMPALTVPTELREFSDWVEHQSWEDLKEELATSARTRRSGSSSGLMGLVAGIFLGGWIFGGDDDE